MPAATPVANHTQSYIGIDGPKIKKVTDGVTTACFQDGPSEEITQPEMLALGFTAYKKFLGGDGKVGEPERDYSGDTLKRITRMLNDC
jgi:hypothetical protein